MLSSQTRFARNGGVDAKDFQRVWREREHLFSEPDPAPGGDVGGREEASRPGGEARREGRREEGGGGVGPEKIFEFGKLFQKFDTDGDGRLGRADFERLVGGMLEQVGERGGDGTRRGSRGGEGDNGNAPSAAPQPLPPPPAVPPSPAGPSITHYDETTGVPLAREAVASQQALGHTVVPLREAYSRRLSRLQLRRRLHGRGEELRAARAAIERETLADAEAIVERLRSAETLKQAMLTQGVNSVTAELEGVEKLSDQTACRVLMDLVCATDFEGTERMVELVQSYRELCNSIDRVANKPFDPTIDVQADDFPHETAERLEVLRRADRYEHALSVKDQMLWEAMQVSDCRLQSSEMLADKVASEVSPVVSLTTALSSESQRLEEKCQEERSLGREFAEEAQEWVTLTGKLSDRVNALTVEAERTAQLRKV
ncbi:unnamed protein product [Ectocarpus sp. CCAP 1310/34]|nr:unnamed protein product [Ectocarpus sp. CCAP 1310/34]